jgi:hypothetical protein
MFMVGKVLADTVLAFLFADLSGTSSAAALGALAAAGVAPPAIAISGVAGIVAIASGTMAARSTLILITDLAKLSVASEGGGGESNENETGSKIDPQVSKKIERALRSPNENIRLEGEVAKALGDEVISFQRNIDRSSGRIGEIDVETSSFIIEVTNGGSSKGASEFLKYFQADMNPLGKGVILYAPNLHMTKLASIEAAGVKVIQNMEALINLIIK